MLSLHRFEQSGGILSATQHLLQFGRPTLSEYRTLALAMKSIAPLSSATSCPAASVSLVTEPSSTGGIAR